MHTLLKSNSSLSKLPIMVAGGVVALLLTGCAETREANYYNPQPASTTRDALETAEGGVGRATIQAPSQIQIKFQSGQEQSSGETTTVQVTDELTPAGQAELQKENKQAQASEKSGFILQPETFFGTLPCFHRDMQCTAQQVTLTLAPNGRWRARVAYLQNQQASGKPETTQGCWRGLAMNPPQIVLLDTNGNVRAQLRMTSAEVLRLQSIDGQTPNLTYTLNRQPDLDPINELDGVTAPACD